MTRGKSNIFFEEASQLVMLLGRSALQKTLNFNINSMENSRLYVGNLSYDTNDAGLNAHFSQCGEVKSATVIMNKMTGRSKGFGFVDMGTPEEAQKAIETLNGKELDGRQLTVDEARPMTTDTQN